MDVDVLTEYIKRSSKDTMYQIMVIETIKHCLDSSFTKTCYRNDVSWSNALYQNDPSKNDSHNYEPIYNSTAASNEESMTFSLDDEEEVA